MEEAGLWSQGTGLVQLSLTKETVEIRYQLKGLTLPRLSEGVSQANVLTASAVLMAVAEQVDSSLRKLRKLETVEILSEKERIYDNDKLPHDSDRMARQKRYQSYVPLITCGICHIMHFRCCCSNCIKTFDPYSCLTSFDGVAGTDYSSELRGTSQTMILHTELSYAKYLLSLGIQFELTEASVQFDLIYNLTTHLVAVGVVLRVLALFQLVLEAILMGTLSARTGS
ncbi:hypothetical protein T11_10655 [Trichinella zimbabwensis]|uniref:Uncharacterized protein n=1 Tax=Trichinella zimbabwensis TaxID=268475 RepID=A0A0V1HN88_9BILA|nr:hypothetical protein T11_10655 [Trichinella zimbabwensis]